LIELRGDYYFSNSLNCFIHYQIIRNVRAQNYRVGEIADYTLKLWNISVRNHCRDSYVFLARKSVK